MDKRKQSAIDMIITIGLGGGIVCGILALVLNVLVFPIVYLIFHDCGRFICWHMFEMSWTSFLITFCVLFVIMCLLVLLGGNTNPPRKNAQPRRQRRTYGRETDYYDEDMEGAPGYYGED